MAKRAPMSIRLTDEEQATVDHYVRNLGISPTAVLRMALRQLRLRGILLPDQQEPADAEADDSPDE